MASQTQDLTASIDELRADLASCPPEMRPILVAQIAALENAKTALLQVEPEIRTLSLNRPPIDPSLLPHFQPDSPAIVPTWINDQLQRHEPSPSLLRCPPEARIYETEDSVACAISAAPGSVPVPHGLSLSFYKHSGHLRTQLLYDRGLVRWAIEYHPSGPRSSVSFYADELPKEYRPHGVHSSFAPNGTIIAQTTYFRGIRHGWARLWEDDGYPILASYYDRGQQIESIRPDGSRQRNA